MKKIAPELLENIVKDLGENRPEEKLCAFRELSAYIPDIDQLISIHANNKDDQYLRFCFVLDITCNVLTAADIPLRPVSQSLWIKCLVNNAYMYALAKTNKKKDIALLDHFLERYFQPDFLEMLFAFLEPEKLTPEKLVRFFRYAILAKSICDVMYLSAHNNQAEPGTILYVTDLEPSLRGKHAVQDCMEVLFPDNDDMYEDREEDIDRLSSHSCPENPFFHEYTTWKLHKQMEDQGATESENDMETFMKSVMASSKEIEFIPKNDEDRSSDLTYQAFETENEAAMEKLSREALKLDPDNADAYVHLASLSDTNEEILDYLQKGIAAGERKTADLPDSDTGKYWGIIETRPFMRALYEYSYILIELNRFSEAIDVLERMLTLDADDNQNVRIPLILVYLTRKKFSSIQKLVKQFPHDRYAQINWNAVLVNILTKNSKQACSALKHARKQNSYVYDFLTEKHPLPNDRPSRLPAGSREEAIDYCFACKRFWTKKAIAWLKKN